MAHNDSLFTAMLNRINDLTAAEFQYTRRYMRVSWAQMRAAFKRERDRRNDLTQTKIAVRGKVSQSAISKIENDEDYTPQVDTFVNALHGLGLSAAEFFAQIEGLKVHRQAGTITGIVTSHGEDSSISPPPAPYDDRVQAFILDLIVAMQDLVANYEARYRGNPPAPSTDREAPATRTTAARKNPRTGTHR